MIILYKGSRGKGKTLTMVRDAYKMYSNGYNIYSNMTLSFGKYISSEDVLELNKDSMLFNCVLVLDELQLFFDSRNFTRQKNKDFSNFIQQSRKRNIHIFYTTQYINTVDLRIRQQTDIIAYPNFDDKTKFCHVFYFDLTKLEDDFEVLALNPVTVVYDAKPIFKLYDTYEMLK